MKLYIGILFLITTFTVALTDRQIKATKRGLTLSFDLQPELFDNVVRPLFQGVGRRLEEYVKEQGVSNIMKSVFHRLSDIYYNGLPLPLPFNRQMIPFSNRQVNPTVIHFQGFGSALYKTIWQPLMLTFSRPWRDLVFLPKETYFDTQAMIESVGLNAEKHVVTTEDGYYITMFRIPSKKGTDGKSIGKPILINNILFCCSSREWVSQMRNQSLAFVLADAGYDVWLGNYRGGPYSKTHVKLNEKGREFWSFSLDEMGKYDVPAMIDYVIKESGHSKIYLSAGGIGYLPVAFALSEYPENNEKLHALISLSGSPYIYDTKMKSIVQGVSRLVLPVIKYMSHNIIIASFLNPTVIRWINPYLVNLLAPVVLGFSTPVIEGTDFNPNSYNISRFAVFAGSLPVTFGGHGFIHLTEILAKGGPVHYDWGDKKINMEKYGHEKPTFYDIRKITVPTLITYTQHDLIIAEEEAKAQKNVMKSVKLYKVPDKTWSHFAYMLFINGQPVWEEIMKFMREHEN